MYSLIIPNIQSHLYNLVVLLNFNNTDFLEFTFKLLEIHHMDRFPVQTSSFFTVLVGLGLVYSIGLNFALYQTHLNSCIQQVYQVSKNQTNIFRTYFYCFLISANITVLIIISLIFQPNTNGITISLQSDIFHILIICGYIIRVEESRQTSLNGYLLIRDVVFYLLLLIVLSFLISSKPFTILECLGILSVLLIFLIIKDVNNSLQFHILQLLGLIKQQKGLSIELLQSQVPRKYDINQLQDIINQNTEIVNQEIEKFNILLKKVIKNQKQLRIRKNLALIVNSIKKGIEIKKIQQKEERSSIYQKFWSIKQKYASKNKEPNETKQVKFQQSYIEKNSEKPSNNQKDTQKIIKNIDQNIPYYHKILKIIYYPLYYTKDFTLRLKYLCYIISIFIAIANMWYINFAFRYIQKSFSNSEFIVLIVSHLLCIPNFKYFFKLSHHNDYDFYNIFFESGILKIGFSLCIGFFLNSITNSSMNVVLDIKDSYKYYLFSKILTILVFFIFMIVIKFLPRNPHFRYSIILFGIIYVLNFGIFLI